MRRRFEASGCRIRVFSGGERVERDLIHRNTTHTHNNNKNTNTDLIVLRWNLPYFSSDPQNEVEGEVLFYYAFDFLVAIHI